MDGILHVGANGVSHIVELVGLVEGLLTLYRVDVLCYHSLKWYCLVVAELQLVLILVMILIIGRVVLGGRHAGVVGN